MKGARFDTDPGSNLKGAVLEGSSSHEKNRGGRVKSQAERIDELVANFQI